MSALILKSGNALNAGIERLDFTIYMNRVLADGGFIANEQALKDAFAFVSANGIASSEVFSATSASWGIKLNGAGKPIKLYSLFGNRGDIDATIGQPSYINYNTSSHSVPVIEFKGSSFNIFKTSGVTGTVFSAGHCIISKVKMQTSGSLFGASNFFGIGELSDLTDSTTVADSSKKQYLTSIAQRLSTSANSDEWFHYVVGHGYSGKILTNKPVGDAGRLVGLDKWSHTSSFVNNVKLNINNNGLLLGESNAVIPTMKDNNLSFILGSTRSTTSATLAYSIPLYGDIAEAWCMINTTQEHMLALSLRASQIYTD